jgi:hypothetical protein
MPAAARTPLLSIVLQRVDDVLSGFLSVQLESCTILTLVSDDLCVCSWGPISFSLHLRVSSSSREPGALVFTPLLR